MAIKLNIETSKIEFDFAGLIVVADASDENIAKMLDLKDSEISEKAEKEKERLKDLEADEITGKKFKEAIQTTLELYSEIYSPVFGDEAFKNVYNHVGSIRTTVEAFEEGLDYITEELEKRNENSKRRHENKLNKYKKRKSNK